MLDKHSRLKTSGMLHIGMFFQCSRSYTYQLCKYYNTLQSFKSTIIQTRIYFYIYLYGTLLHHAITQVMRLLQQQKKNSDRQPVKGYLLRIIFCFVFFGMVLWTKSLLGYILRL